MNTVSSASEMKVQFSPKNWGHFPSFLDFPRLWDFQLSSKSHVFRILYIPWYPLASFFSGCFNQELLCKKRGNYQQISLGFGLSWEWMTWLRAVEYLGTLPETNIFAPENRWFGWKMILSFWGDFGLFSGANLLLVSGVVYFFLWSTCVVPGNSRQNRCQAVSKSCRDLLAPSPANLHGLGHGSGSRKGFFSGCFGQVSGFSLIADHSWSTNMHSSRCS